jgi:tRNA(Ile)-lysidine synthase
MQPFGMQGRKLLSDLMTDLKMTLFEKRRQLVVVDAEGIVVWLVGLRTDNRCRVDHHTHNVLTISRQQPRP